MKIETSCSTSQRTALSFSITIGMHRNELPHAMAAVNDAWAAFEKAVAAQYPPKAETPAEPGEPAAAPASP